MKIATNKNVKKGIMLILCYAFLMSISTAFTKQTQTIINPFTLIFWQSLLCCLFVLPKIKSAQINRFKPIWKLVLLRSLAGFFALICFYFALNHIPIVEAALLRNCAPLCVPLIVLIFYRKAITIKRLVPLTFGFIGVLVVMRPTATDISVWHIVGFTSAVGLAVSMVTTRMISAHISANESLFGYFFVSTICALIILIITENSVVIPAHSWLWVVVVAISLYFGLYLYTLAYSFAPASIVSPVSYIGIVFNGLLGWIVWHHVPDIFAWVGALLIIFSIWMTSKTP